MTCNGGFDYSQVSFIGPNGEPHYMPCAEKANNMSERHNSETHRNACHRLTTEIPLPTIDNPVYEDGPIVREPDLDGEPSGYGDGKRAEDVENEAKRNVRALINPESADSAGRALLADDLGALFGDSDLMP